MGENKADERDLLNEMLDNLPLKGRLVLTLRRSHMATSLLNEEVVAKCCLVPGCTLIVRKERS